MYNKEIKIDLMKYLSSSSRITLNPKFRFYLFNEAIKIAGNRTKLSKIIGVNKTSIWEWKVGRGSRKPTLDAVLKCTEIVGVGELKKYIIGATSRLTGGTIYVKHWKLNLDANFAEWLGLLEGDGSVTEKYVSCGNTFFELVFYFISYLERQFNIKKRQFDITIWRPIGNSWKESRFLEKIIKQRGFERVKIRERSLGKKAKQILIEARVNSKILASILRNLSSNLADLLRKSPNSIKASYISGFASAEGSIVKDKNSRRLTISQKYPNKLLFIKELLNTLGFKSITEPEPTTGAYRIAISNRRDLEKYINEIGFGHHEMRNQKMREILSSYSLKEYKLRSERFKEILSLFEKSQKLTGSIIAKQLNTDYKQINHILNQMLREKLLLVDNSSKPYIYSPSDNYG